MTEIEAIVNAETTKAASVYQSGAAHVVFFGHMHGREFACAHYVPPRTYKSAKAARKAAIVWCA